MRILAIDDHPMVLKALAKLLRECEVIAVTNIRSAMDAIEEYGNFDHIICDMMIGDETGKDFYEQMKREHPFLAEKIIFCTGGATTPETSEFLSVTKLPIVTKPFTPADIRKAVNG
jgi:DNA-binding NtrC family response regulator